MPQTTPNLHDEPTPSDEARERAEVQPRDYYYDDLVSFAWPSIGRGIILAGGVYPIILGAIQVSLMVVAAVFSHRAGDTIDASGLVMLLIGAPMFAIMAGIIGLIWASAVAVVTLPVVHLVVWSMKLRTGIVLLGAFSGGLVAFLAILPFTLQVSAMFKTGSAWGALIMLIFGPGLATVLGQLGGARGGRLAAQRVNEKMELRRSLVAIGWRLPPVKEVGHDEDRLFDADQPRFRFRIIHLLWVGVWLSLLLTVIRLSGIPYELILPLLLGWLAYQAATLWLGRRLARWLGPWWNRRRQIRST